MMGRTHALTGVAGGCLLAGAVPGPLLPRAVAAGLVVVGSLAPDIDHPRATITRALWLLGDALHAGTVAGGRAIFRATATRWDVDDWNDGHRLITHTGIGALAAGTAVGTGTAGLGYAVSPVLPALGAGILAAWWLWGLAFGWGCLVHILGDLCTVQGVPLLWPRRIRGKRWWMVRVPLVHAGGDGERRGVVPVAWGLIVVSVLWMVGLLGPLVTFLGSLG